VVWSNAYRFLGPEGHLDEAFRFRLLAKRLLAKRLLFICMTGGQINTTSCISSRKCLGEALQQIF
jgi:hypothetical protein